MASSWEWIWEFEQRAVWAEDVSRVRLARMHLSAYEISHDLPDQKLEIYRAARDLAIQLGEPWWEMFYEHWIIEVLLFGKNLPHEALDHAVRAVFRVSQPQFDALPERVGLQINLASAYTYIDPIGYESELRALFPHIEAGCEQLPEYRAYHHQVWGYFLEFLGDAGALDAAYRYLGRADEVDADHYRWDAMKMLCTTLYRFNRETAREQLGEWAALGEQIARRESRNRGVSEFLMWRAVAARWDGQEPEAQRLYRQSLMLQMRLAPPRNVAFEAAIAFHEEGGELERALQICQADVRILQSHGLTFILAQRRLEKCRLLLALGRDFYKDAQRLRRVAAKLKSRAHWEAKIAELEAKL